MAATVTVVESHEGRYVQAVQAGRHVWRADEPEAVGGDDAGPAPTQMLLAALGSCTSMTLRMYADRKGWKLTHVEVLLRFSRADKGSLIVSNIVLDGELDEAQRRRLLEIAEKCPLHRILTGETRIVSGLVGRPSPPTGGEE